MKAKERNKIKLLEYLGNPENKFCDRTTMALKVLGYKDQSLLYRYFNCDELAEIEKEALAMRRKKYSPEIAKVDKAMLKQAKEGNDKAAKLCYQRFEDWGEKKQVDHAFRNPPRFEAIVEMIATAQKEPENSDG